MEGLLPLPIPEQKQIEKKLLGGSPGSFLFLSAELGLLAGAERVEATLFGNGERTGKRYWGVGLSHNINLAPLRGILSAINRAWQDRHQNQ